MALNILFIDTEFNGFNGELISMALYHHTGKAFYEVLECLTPEPWVKAHVIPNLKKNHVSYEVFQAKLSSFLNSFTEDLTIAADWPEDITHFCRCLITGPGQMMPTPSIIGFVLDRSLNSAKSATPHNALDDAIDISREYYRR